MPRPLNDQVVVITGASSGIGRATAVAFGRRGASVVFGARDESALPGVRLDAYGVTSYTVIRQEGRVRVLRKTVPQDGSKSLRSQAMTSLNSLPQS